jgi:hypothetical protein
MIDPILNCPAGMGTIAKHKLPTGNFCSYFSKVTVLCCACTPIEMEQNKNVIKFLTTIHF